MERNDERQSRSDNRTSSSADGYSQRSNRKRTRNSSNEDKNLRTEKTTEEEVRFSFLNHKRFFHRLLMGYNVIEQLVDNASDFWLFLTKYEALLRRSGQSILAIQTEAPENKSIIPKEFNKGFLINLKLKPSKNHISSYHDEDKHIDETKIKIFLTIVKHYLDFKQKERFQKIKKLRKFQASLPIAAYEKEIVEAVKNESILVLAGDSEVFFVLFYKHV